MNFTQAKELKEQLDQRVEQASQALKVFERGEMGLTPDHVKATPEFKKAKSEFDKAFRALRSFNSSYIKTFKKELREERNNKLNLK